MNRCRDVTVEIAFLDKRVFPNRFHQVVLIDGIAGILNKSEQNIEVARRKRDGQSVLQQPTLLDLDTKLVKLKKMLCRSVRRHDFGKIRKFTGHFCPVPSIVTK